MFEQVDEPATASRPSFARLVATAGLGGVPRGAIGGCVVLVVLALGVAGWRLGGAAASGEFSYVDSDVASVSEDSVPGPVAAAADEEPTPLWVHVAGAVRVPGLYELEPGARVGDALTVAGGTLDDAALDAVNLARLLADGEQVYVPSEEEVEAGVAQPGAAAAGAAPNAAPGGGAVDINTATAGELEALPGVGPATAAKIIAEREANGPFAAPEDLMRVAGIGEKKFEALRDLIVVR
ncbi:MAG: ComEA family DNA-binding protein [Anaerosomatales bacterium]|nr:ComEA family DNA-binding protein [Anaerosomatales bacterium]MDT8433537.1 ComEA family DNA-binding protein [Anaerosomatales bacterium]